jgi:hypothetical protein
MLGEIARKLDRNRKLDWNPYGCWVFAINIGKVPTKVPTIFKVPGFDRDRHIPSEIRRPRGADCEGDQV